LRRVYYMNPKRKQIVQEAMLQMRATSAALGPEFMTRIRMLIKDCDPEYISQILGAPPAQAENAVAEPPEHSPEPTPWNPAENVATEPVDQKKNLLIIMKFLQLKQDNKSVQNQVRMLLAEKHTIQ
jgi:hypothetical protein